jgi:tellurite resistance protein TerC
MIETLLFPFSQYAWLYGAFIAFVCAMLALDLGVFHRKAHVVSFKEAAGWSIFWVSLSLLLNFAFYNYALHKFTTDPTYTSIDGFNAHAEASRVGLEFLTGFVVEKALAIDNIFVFVLLFAAFGIPAQYQHRVLFFGIIGAIAFRALFIAIGSQLMAYHWVVVLFGVFLVITGVKMLFMGIGGPVDPSQSKIIRFLRRTMPVTDEIHGQRFFIRKAGVLTATPLFIALVFLEFTDIIFAVDSVPAIFAITKEPMIVFMSNILAILGLRSLYFMLAGVIDRFIYLKFGLALVLVFVGLKMVWLNELMGGKFPIGLSLGIIATLILGSIFASLIATRNRPVKQAVLQGELK